MSNPVKELNTTEGNNRFRFQPFRERVKAIKIDVAHKIIRDPGVSQDDDASFFRDGLDRWQELNCTAHFTLFVRDVRQNSLSLVQILYHKDTIINSIVRHLEVPSTLAYEPLLDLTINLARDLQDDFYPYFPRIFASIAKLLEGSDLKLIECAFNALAYLLKYLAKELLEDIIPTFELLESLLRHEKPFIRRFAAEAFSTLLRKVQGASADAIYSHMVESLRRSPDDSKFAETISILCFETVKQVKGNLHSRASSVLKRLLRVTIGESVDEQDIAYKMLVDFFYLLGHSTAKEHMSPMWNMILGELEVRSNANAALDENQLHLRLGEIMSLAHIWLVMRRGGKVPNRVPIYGAVEKLSGYIFDSSRLSNCSQFTRTAYLKLVTGLLTTSSMEEVLTRGKVILQKMFECQDASFVLEFCELARLEEWEYYSQILLPHLFSYVQREWQVHEKKFILSLATLFQDRFERHLNRIPFSFRTANNLIRLDVKSNPESNILQSMLQFLSDAETRRGQQSESPDYFSILGLSSAILSCIPYLTLPFDVIFEALSNFLLCQSQALAAFDVTEHDAEIRRRRSMLSSIAGQAIGVVAKFAVRARESGRLPELWPVVLEGLLPKMHLNMAALRGIADYLECLKESKGRTKHFAVRNLEAVLPIAGTQIGSFDGHVRLHALRILASFEQVNLRPVKDSIFTGACPILSICLDLENIPNTVATIRDKTVLLRRLDALVSSRTIPELYMQVPARYLTALLSVPFAPLWDEAIKSLCNVANVDMGMFWPVFHERLTQNEGLQRDDVQDFSFPESLVNDPQTWDPSAPIFEANGITVSCRALGNANAHTRASRALFSDVDRSLLAHALQLMSAPKDRFDGLKYYSLLVRVLAELPHVVEKQSRSVVPLFLSLFNGEDSTDDPIDIVVDSKCRGTAPSEPGTIETEVDTLQAQIEIKEGARSKVLDYLTAFSKLRHPNKMQHASRLYSIYLELLCKGDDRLQQRAFECILTWKQGGITYLADVLKGLTEDDKFRDSLSTLDMDDINANVNVADRASLMEVLVRILYGKLISRKGRTSASGLKARRTAIFAFFTSVDESMRRTMVHLMVQPFRAILTQTPQNYEEFRIVDTLHWDWLGSLKKQIGYLHVLEDSVKQLKTLLVPFLPTLLKVVLYVLHSAEKGLRGGRDVAESEDTHLVTSESQHRESQLREIRLLSIRRLKETFEANLDFDFTPYIKQMFRSFIDTRMSNFRLENTQAPSALLELFSTWSKNRRYVFYLVEYTPVLVPNVLSLLSAKKVRETVVSVVLEMIQSILEVAEEYPADGIMEKALVPHLTVLLSNFNNVLSCSFQGKAPVKLTRDTVPSKIISSLARLAPYVTDPKEAGELLDMMLPYTKRPAKSVPETTKMGILKIFTNFLPILPLTRGTPLGKTSYYAIASQLLGILETREAREELLRAFDRFAMLDSDISLVAELVKGLDAYSKNRIDEPDFDQRFSSYGRISQTLHQSLTAVQWLPILQDLLFYVQEQEEFSIRTSASFCVSQFIARASVLQLNSGPDQQEERSDMMNLVIHVVFPSIKRGLKLNAVLVRQEYINLLGELVSTFPSLPQFSDMVGLMADGDDEASFFTNIYHMQLHRRVRALRRLADECTSGRLSGVNVSNIFVPVVAHFIFESDRVQDHNLINEAISTIAACASQLTWGHYWALLKRFLNAMAHRPALERVLNRVIINILEKFHFAMETGLTSKAIAAKPAETDERQDDLNDEHDEGGDAIELTAETAMDVDGEEQRSRQAVRVHSAVIHTLLPKLQSYVAKEDVNSLPVRIPIALAIAKLLQRLPSTSMEVQLAKLITTLCNFLRSRGQEARDTTRDTLVKIATLLGSNYFPFILKELEGALTRGYQLHVLGYTLHSLLVNIIPAVTPGSLDKCVEDLMRVCMADIFGETGAEREVEELRGKMREIKSTKSFESLELISQVISFALMPKILLPLKELMLETNSAQVTRKLEEIFRKLALGLNKNSTVTETGLMVFIHELVMENLPLSQTTAQSKREKSMAEKNFLVQLRRNDPVEPLKYFQANAHMFIEFGLSLLLTALRTERVNIRNELHLQMLDPLVELLGRSLYSKHISVSIQALRILCIIVKAPLPKLKEAMPVIVRRLFEIIGKSLTTSAELVQATFRLLTIVIRDCKHVTVNQDQLVALISVLRPDLEAQEPDRQTTTFALIRAILTRKFVVNEVYDLMDAVTKIMVTSQSSQVRDLCRQAHVQFLLDYPHGPSRLRKQLTYLIKNLSYEHQSGRESVLEMLNTVIVKFNDSTLFEYCEMLFVALVMSLVNDESAKCREMAGNLLRSLVGRLDTSRTAKLSVLIEKWFDQKEQPHLQRTAAQVSGLVLEASGDRERKWLPTLFQHLDTLLLDASLRLETLVESEAEEHGEGDDVSWEVAYYTLNTFLKAIMQFPATVHNASTTSIWERICQLMMHPHQWVRIACNRVLGTVFNLVDAKTRCVARAPAAGPHPLLADKGPIRSLGQSLCAQLQSDTLTAELAKQIVKNLFFLGKCAFELERENENDSVTMDIDGNDMDDNRSDEGDEPIDDDTLVEVNSTHKRVLLSLWRRLAYMARADASKRRGPLLRRSIFQWFAAMVNYIPSAELEPYSFHVVSTLYRTTMDETAKGKDADELRLLAKEVLDLVQKQIGTAQYLDVYNKVHFRVQAVRQERKAQRSVQAVLDPEGRARRRAQKNDMKRANRKRKADEFASRKVKAGISKKMRIKS